MTMEMMLLIGLGVAAMATGIGAFYFARLESSEPNQWLLLIRDGEPIKAGIGIQVWRRLNDTVARFTSTMQRVTFNASILTQDKQQLQIKGFLLWVVSAEGDAPFKAFSRLGIAHREPKGSHDPEYHHALSRAQHHAFRRSVEAAIHKVSVGFTLREALEDPEQLASRVKTDLAQTVNSWGIVLETLELTEIEVAQVELLEHMQAPYITQSRKEATELQLTADAEIAQMRMSQHRELARREAETRRQQEKEQAEIALAQAREAAALAEEQAEIERERIAHELKLQEAQAEAQHQQALEQLNRLHAQKVAEQEQAFARQEQLEQLRDLEANAERQRVQRQREDELAHREALLALERDKPQAIREAELARELMHSASDAMSTLPIKEVRWLSGSERGPEGIFMGMLDTLQQVTANLRPSNDS